MRLFGGVLEVAFAQSLVPLKKGEARLCLQPPWPNSMSIAHVFVSLTFTLYSLARSALTAIATLDAHASPSQFKNPNPAVTRWRRRPPPSARSSST